jgi:hypothetical protein
MQAAVAAVLAVISVAQIQLAEPAAAVMDQHLT